MLRTFSNRNASARNSITSLQNSRISDRRSSGRAFVMGKGRGAICPLARARRYRESCPGSVQYDAFENGWHGGPPMATQGSFLERPAKERRSCPMSADTSASKINPERYREFRRKVSQAIGSLSIQSL